MTKLLRHDSDSIYGTGTALSRDANGLPNAAGRSRSAIPRHDRENSDLATRPRPQVGFRAGMAGAGRPDEGPPRLQAAAPEESQKQQKAPAPRRNRKPGVLCARAGLWLRGGETGWRTDVGWNDRAVAERNAAFGEQAQRLASLGNPDAEEKAP